MRNCKTVSLIVVAASLIALPLMAAPWPDAHSTSYLGVHITSVSPQQASALNVPGGTGAVITYVDQDGPACHAGLLENDVVVGFNGSKVDSPQQLQSLIRSTPAQKTVTMSVIRGGQRKDVKVTLGSWNVAPNVRAFPAMGMTAPPPPIAYPDIEIPSFTLLSARYGLVVESLSPQLADFFGVARGQGVLVRSVENGSAASAAGLRAGDIILKVNNDVVHDMSDWQRGMRSSGKKLSVVIWRDKKNENVTITVPGSGDSSRLIPGDMFQEELRPEMMAQLNDKDLEQMRKEIDQAMEQQKRALEKISREMAKAAKPTAEDMEKMRAEIQRSMPNEKELADMTRQIQASVPSKEELDKIRQQVDEAMKSFTPQLQQQMDELKKQMEQLDLQQLMKGMGNDQP